MSAYGRVKIVHRAFVRALVIMAILFTLAHGSVCAADKLRIAYVSPSITMSPPWVARSWEFSRKTIWSPRFC